MIKWGLYQEYKVSLTLKISHCKVEKSNNYFSKCRKNIWKKSNTYL